MPLSLLTDPASRLSGPIGQLTEMGGPVMAILLAIGVIGLATFLYLMFFGALFAPRLTRALKHQIVQWQRQPDKTLGQALQACSGLRARFNPLHGLVCHAMLGHGDASGSEQLRQTLARDAQRAMEPFEAPLRIIEVIAALAPLLGLLGTVMGMMEAFSAMAASAGRANATQLSGGIYEALTTTAAGLVVAIPFAALAAWTEFRLRRINRVINSTLVTILSAEAAVTGAATQSAGATPVRSVARSETAQEVAGELPAQFASAAG